MAGISEAIKKRKKSRSEGNTLTKLRNAAGASGNTLAEEAFFSEKFSNKELKSISKSVDLSGQFNKKALDKIKKAK